jgi:hypothetical protein
MAATFVQKATANGADGSGGINVTLTGVTAGNFLTLQISLGDRSTPTLPTDSNGTWVSAVPGTAIGVSYAADMVCYQGGAAGGTHTGSTGGYANLGYMITLCEWAGMGATSSVDVQASDFTNSVSATVPSQTLVQANELVLGTFCIGDLFGNAAAAITDPPTGYTSLAVQDNTTPANGYIGAEHCYIANAGSTALPATTWACINSASITYLIASVVTFKVIPPVPTNRPHVFIVSS